MNAINGLFKFLSLALALGVGLSSAWAETGGLLRSGSSLPQVWIYDMSAAGGVGRITSPNGAWSLPCDRTGARLDLYWCEGAAGQGALEVPTLAQEFVALGGGAVRTNLWNVGLSDKGFAGCSSLTDLSFASDFVCQQLPSFANCSNLVSVSIPKGVANVGTSSFDGCVGLRMVSVEAGGAVGSVLKLPVPETDVEEDHVITHCTGWDDWCNDVVSQQSFRVGENGLDARLATLQFSHETVAGGDAAYLFSYEGLAERVVIPSAVGGVRVAGIDSLGCNDQVREVEISEGIEEIAENAFDACQSLERVSVPSSVGYLGNGWYNGCDNLMQIDFAGGELAGQWVDLPVAGCANTRLWGWNEQADGSGRWWGENGFQTIPAAGMSLHAVRTPCDFDFTQKDGGIIVSQYGSQAGSGETFVVDRMAGQTVVGLACYALSGLSGYASIRIAGTVRTLDDYAFEGSLNESLTNIVFDAGALAGQDVNVPVPTAPEGMQFLGWRFSEAGREDVWSRYIWDENLCESRLCVRVPEDGASFVAVFVSDQIAWDEAEDGIILNGYPIADDVVSFAVPGDIAGRSVVGIGSDLFAGQITISSVSIPNSVRSVAEGSLNESLTNIVFDAGALAGQDVNVPVPTAPEGMQFLGWRFSEAGREDVWSRYIWDENLCESRLCVRVPEDGASFVAVFVSDQIAWDEAEDGIILNGYPIADDVVSFAVPGDIAGRSVVGIGSDLFAGRSALTSVSIPNPVRFVAECAFADTGIWNESPEGLVVADGWVVGRKYEDECLVDTVTVGSEIRGIAEGVFNGWSSLRQVSFAGALKNESVLLPHVDQDYSSFYGWCTARDGSGEWALYDENSEAWKATVASAVTFYAVFHDDGVSLEPVDGSDSMRIVGLEHAPQSFTIPTDYDGTLITEIGNDAISGQCDLLDLIIPAGIERVGDGAFSSCEQLGSVRVAETVQTFGTRVFEGCNNLSNVVFEAGAVAGQKVQLPLVADREGERFFGWRRKDADAAVAWSRVAYDDETGTDVCLVTVPEEGAAFEAVFVPDWVEWQERDDGIVLTGYGLTDETLDFAVPSDILGRPVTGIADPLFSPCTELKSVALPESLTFVGQGVFDATPLVTNVVNGFVVVDGWICGRQDAFFGRASRVALPDGVVGIAERALADWPSLRRLELNADLRVIGAGAFSGSGLVTLSVPANVRFMAEDTFSDCYSLRTLAFSGSGLAGTRLRMPDPSATGMTILGWHATGADWEVWSELECDESNDVVYDVIEVPDAESCVFSAVFCTGNYAWEVDWETEGVSLVGSDTLPTQAVIPARICGGLVTTLASGAVADAESATEVTVPATVCRISQGAFSSCSRLVKVVLQSGDTTVEGGAFDGCAQLGEIVIGPSGQDHAIYLPLLEDIGYGQPVGWMAETSSGDVWSETVNDPRTGCTCCRVRVPEEGATFKAVYDAHGVSFEERGTALAITCWPTENGLPTDFELPSNIAGRPVVEICAGSLADGWGVRRLTIAEGIEIIREEAFGSFCELEEVVLPASLWYLSEAAFCDCPNLRRIVIPDGELAGQTIPLPAVYRDGETFVGWNTECDGSGEWCGSGASARIPEGGVTLNAVFAPFSAEWRKTSDGVVITQCAECPSSDVVFDSFGGYPVVGILAEDGLSDCGVARVTFGSSVRTMSASSIQNWMSVTNIEFKAGALSGQQVWLPRELNAYWDEPTETDYAFAWWEGVDGNGERFYVPWTCDANGEEGGYVLTVPETGARLSAVFLPSWIQCEIHGDGLTLNGYGLEDSEETSFDVPAEIHGCPVVRIGASLFAGCSMLVDVTIPACVRSIAEGAFNDTPIVNYAANELVYVDGWLVARRYDNEENLSRLTVAEGTVGIADYALRDLPVKRLDLPDTLCHVGAGAFANTQLTGLCVPDSVISFAATALADCWALRTVTFAGTGLAGTTIGLPWVESSLDSMRFVGWSSEVDGSGSWAHGDCFEDGYDGWYMLQSGIMPSEPTTWYAQMIDYALEWEGTEEGDGVCLISCGDFASGTLTVPARVAGRPVVSISDNFWNSLDKDSITELILPDSLRTLGNVGEWCRLRKVTMPYGLQPLTDGDGVAWGFFSCPQLEEIVVTTGTSADVSTWNIDSLFGPYCDPYSDPDIDVWLRPRILRISFEEGIQILDCPFASKGCCVATSVSAFENVQSVQLPSTMARIVNAELFESAFETGTAGELYLDNWLVGRTSGVFASKLVVREGTVGIADYALEGCACYSEITLPSTLAKIGVGAFEDCASLVSVLFKGNAPMVWQDDGCRRIVSAFSGTPDELLVSVNRDSTGWNGGEEGLPATWPECDGRSIAYLGTGGAAEVLLSLSVYPAEAGTVQGAGLYASGSAVRIQTRASAGYEFLGWAGSTTNAESGIVDMGVCAVKTLSVRESLNVVAVYRPTERYVSSAEDLAFLPAGSAGTSSLAVPGSWLVEKGLATEGVTSTRTAAATLNADGQNGIPVWQSYVLGLDPTEDKSAGEQLKISIDGFDAEGKPIITFTPNRSEDASVSSFVRYTTLGKESLSSDEWLDVNAAENAGRDFRFFRVQATVVAP